MRVDFVPEHRLQHGNNLCFLRAMSNSSGQQQITCTWSRSQYQYSEHRDYQTSSTRKCNPITELEPYHSLQEAVFHLLSPCHPQDENVQPSGTSHAASCILACQQIVQTHAGDAAAEYIALRGQSTHHTRTMESSMQLNNNRVIRWFYSIYTLLEII